MSPTEARHLAFEPRESVAFPGERYFGAYRCKDDCSGHIAGWYWARDNQVTKAVECEGNSMSFQEGCFVYLGVMGRIKDPSAY